MIMFQFCLAQRICFVVSSNKIPPPPINISHHEGCYTWHILNGSRVISTTIRSTKYNTLLATGENLKHDQVVEAFGDVQVFNIEEINSLSEIIDMIL